MRTHLQSTLVLGVTLFLFSAAFPPFDDISEVDLATHMLQHVLLVLAGVLVAYPIYRRRSLSPGRWAAWVSLIASGALIVFWHLPVPWDLAVLNPAIHAVEHVSFFGVGLLIGSWVQGLSDSAKIGALLAGFFGHMGYAFLLVFPLEGQVYELYSVADQSIAGWCLLLTGPSLMAGVAYVLARNPSWLGGFSGGAPSAGRRETVVDRIRVPRWVAPALTAALLVAAAGYGVMTASALASGSAGAGGPATIQIVETPVSWQYAPQRAVVILGVNSTVTWASRSVSYDSVTSRAGAFDSGPIPPGGSFSHTFTTPGTYEYYCVYHPWMSGEVVVLRGTGG